MAKILIIEDEKEFRLLEYFMANPERIISRTSILENVWDTNLDYNTNVVEVYINYRRNKIDKMFPVKLIHSLRSQKNAHLL